MTPTLTSHSLSDYAQSLGYGAHELAQLEADLYRIPVRNVIEMSKRAALETHHLTPNPPL